MAGDLIPAWSRREKRGWTETDTGGTGLSMGGYGTWYLARKYPTKFAAIAPICGGIQVPAQLAAERHIQLDPTDAPYIAAAEKVKGLPIWIFHGGDDPVVPASESQKMVKALQALKADVTYTEYSGIKHNSWDRAYYHADFPQWLLAQQRK